MKLEVVGLVVGSLAAFAALVNALVALFTSRRSARPLTITFEPQRWMQVRGSSDGVHNVGFIVGVWVFNPATTPNALRGVRAWVNGHEVDARWLAENVLMGGAKIEPFDSLRGRIVVDAARDTADPQAAYGSVRRVRVRVASARGRSRRRTFKRSEFRDREP